MALQMLAMSESSRRSSLAYFDVFFLGAAVAGVWSSWSS